MRRLQVRLLLGSQVLCFFVLFVFLTGPFGALFGIPGLVELTKGRAGARGAWGSWGVSHRALLFDPGGATFPWSFGQHSPEALANITWIPYRIPLQDGLTGILWWPYRPVCALMLFICGLIIPACLPVYFWYICSYICFILWVLIFPFILYRFWLAFLLLFFILCILLLVC